MSCLNRVYVSGNLTRDPQVKQLPSGTHLAELGLAINERFETRKGDPVERTVFLDIVAWDRQAEISAEHLRKGSRIAVEGSLQQDTWEDKDGRRQSRLRLRAERVLILQRGPTESSATHHGQGHPAGDPADPDAGPRRAPSRNPGPRNPPTARRQPTPRA